MAHAVVPDPIRRPNPDPETRSSLFFYFFIFLFFESFRIIKIQLLFQTYFTYSMKIYIRESHFNIKGAHHLITKHFFFIRCGISCPFGPFPTFIQCGIISRFQYPNIYKHNQSSIFIIVFLQNESNNFMYSCDEALLILCVTLTMILIHCGLRLHTCSLCTSAMIKATC